MESGYLLLGIIDINFALAVIPADARDGRLAAFRSNYFASFQEKDKTTNKREDIIY